MRELSLNIMDVVQNSITANASFISITIEQSDSLRRLKVSIQDNGKGMTPEQISQVTDPFFTSRTTRKVGLGIPLFKMAAEQTGGSFHIESQIDKGTMIYAVFDTSHIDMTPLGDINSTISILIRCNPKIDFLYSFKTDKGDFDLDTRALREILGDEVELDNPDVLSWIEGSLKEDMDNLL